MNSLIKAFDLQVAYIDVVVNDGWGLSVILDLEFSAVVANMKVEQREVSVKYNDTKS